MDRKPHGSAGLSATRRRRRRAGLPIAIGIVVALLGTMIFVAEPIRTSSVSMMPTIADGSELVVNKIAYSGSAPERNDIVLISMPGAEEDLLVKRVVALGGDVIGMEDGVLVLNGIPLDEPWVDQPSIDGNYFGPVQVPEGHVWVLGDNRAESIDSRAFGPVSLDDIVGRADMRLWPKPGRLS